MILEHLKITNVQFEPKEGATLDKCLYEFVSFAVKNNCNVSMNFHKINYNLSVNDIWVSIKQSKAKQYPI